MGALAGAARNREGVRTLSRDAGCLGVAGNHAATDGSIAARKRLGPPCKAWEMAGIVSSGYAAAAGWNFHQRCDNLCAPGTGALI